jgi:hypothetical protein
MDIKAYQKKYRENNRDRINARAAIWRKSHKEGIRAAARKSYRENGAPSLRRPYGSFSKYRSNANERGIEFSLVLEDFVRMWRKPCSYCGDEISTIGLDRVNSFSGYARDNVVPCCKTCNVAKMRMSRNAYLEHCLKVVAYSSAHEKNNLKQ